MTIQRQYSLPNCTLVLEGWGDTGLVSPSEARPLMSKLVNAECHLVGEEKPLTGGLDFFESLTAAVSLYAQELLSGIHPVKPHSETALVALQRLDETHHRLNVHPPDADPGSGIAAHLTRQVDLTTVQLFDLVEAVDQFFADTQTLPDLSLKVTPLSKRYVRSSEPVVKQAVPAVIGASGVALAAIAFFFIPAPQVRQPDDLVPKASTTASTTGTSSPAASPPPSPIASGSSTPSPTPAAVSPSPSPSTSAAQPDLATLESTLTAALEITDPAQIATLQKQLSSKLDQTWKNRTAIPQDLVYRVGVAKDGAIIGYKPVNPAALTYAKQTPLLDLLYIPTSGAKPPTSEPIAQFKVVFKANGTLDVTPWKDTAASLLTGATEITDEAQMKDLQPKLYDQIDKNWKDKPSFKKELTFRVRVKQDGTIVDYKPDDSTAADYTGDIPLPKLGKLADDGDAGTAQEPLALFKVVFKPDGKLEVSPWRGRKN